MWRAFAALLQRHAESPPHDWMEWALRMRHTMVHRPRQFLMFIQRERQGPPLIVVSGTNPHELAMRGASFDAYLRRRPWVPNLHDMATAGRAQDLWLQEPVQVTLPGIRILVNGLVEECAQLLASSWQTSSGRLQAPADEWRVTPPEALRFIGVAPTVVPAISRLHMSDVSGTRTALAERVRQRLIRESERE